MGMTFKENCPDLRNTRVIDIFNELHRNGAETDVYDPWADKASALSYLDINIQSSLRENYYDAIIVAVAHDEFIQMGYKKIRSFGKVNHILFDLKSIFQINNSDLRL